MKNCSKLIIFFLGTALLDAQSIIRLENNDQLSVNKIHLKGSSLEAEFHSSTVSVPWEKISRILLDGEFVIFTKEGLIFIGTSSPIPPKNHHLLNLKLEDGRILDFKKKDILRILTLERYRLEEKKSLKQKPHRSDRWIGKADLGILLQKGNTDDSQFKIALNTKRLSNRDILNLSLFSSQGEANGLENANSAKILTRYDLKKVSHRFLFLLASFEYDKIKKIDQRTVLGLGYGRTIFDDADKQLELSTGLTVDREDLEDGSRNTLLSALITAEFKMPAFSGNFIEGKINFYPDIKEISKNLKADSTISYLTPISKRTNLKFSLTNRYQQTVLQNLDKLDTLLSTSLSYEF